MRFARRSPTAEHPAIPRLDRERGELVRAVLDSDNVALAELARLRLRAANFVANHATPTDDAVAELECRELAGEPIALDVPTPPSASNGARYVKIDSKLPALDALAASNADRHAAEDKVYEVAMRERSEPRDRPGSGCPDLPERLWTREWVCGLLILSSFFCVIVGVAIAAPSNSAVSYGAAEWLLASLIIVVVAPSLVGPMIRTVGRLVDARRNK